jgi:hypothetical protein
MFFLERFFSISFYELLITKMLHPKKTAKASRILSMQDYKGSRLLGYYLKNRFKTKHVCVGAAELKKSEENVTETGKTKCQICGCEISEENSYTLGDAVLCDDCYMEETHPVQTCDPKAVRSAKVLDSSDEQSGKDKLDELQKALHKFVTDKGKVTLQEICAEFNLSPVRAQNQLAILRHLELIKGKKEADNTYIIPF